MARQDPIAPAAEPAGAEATLEPIRELEALAAAEELDALAPEADEASPLLRAGAGVAAAAAGIGLVGELEEASWSDLESVGAAIDDLAHRYQGLDVEEIDALAHWNEGLPAEAPGAPESDDGARPSVDWVL